MECLVFWAGLEISCRKYLSIPIISHYLCGRSLDMCVRSGKFARYYTSHTGFRHNFEFNRNRREQMQDFKYSAVILTAGESRRMGYPKALLDSGDGRKFLERIIDNLKNLEEKPFEIIPVLGYHREKILEEIDTTGCRAVINPKPELGQLSSLIVALEI